jgi:CspA family cold shock protein
VANQAQEIRQTGVVKWFSDPKGYGFILREQDADIFVHHTAIQMDGFRTLKEGQTVMYDLLQSPKGLQAANVTPVTDGAAQ